MSTLARVLEEAGLATVALSLVRAQAEAVVPPRCLHVEFPLGRPLGKPADATFQTAVLRAALALLERPSGPVLEDFPERIGTAAGDELDSCVLPPRLNAHLPIEVAEALGLRPAYNRQVHATGRTLVGRMISAEQIPSAIEAFRAVADGLALERVPFPVPTPRADHPSGIAFDIRAYYEEAALALAGHVPAARAAEDWFFKHTATGALLKRAQQRLRDDGVPRNVWERMVPTRHGVTAWHDTLKASGRSNRG